MTLAGRVERGFIQDGPMTSGLLPRLRGSAMPYRQYCRMFMIPAMSTLSGVHAASSPPPIAVREVSGSCATSAPTCRALCAPAMAWSRSMP